MLYIRKLGFMFVYLTRHHTDVDKYLTSSGEVIEGTNIDFEGENPHYGDTVNPEDCIAGGYKIFQYYDTLCGVNDGDKYTIICQI